MYNFNYNLTLNSWQEGLAYDWLDGTTFVYDPVTQDNIANLGSFNSLFSKTAASRLFGTFDFVFAPYKYNSTFNAGQPSIVFVPNSYSNPNRGLNWYDSTFGTNPNHFSIYAKVQLGNVGSASNQFGFTRVLPFLRGRNFGLYLTTQELETHYSVSGQPYSYQNRLHLRFDYYGMTYKYVIGTSSGDQPVETIGSVYKNTTITVSVYLNRYQCPFPIVYLNGVRLPDPSVSDIPSGTTGAAYYGSLIRTTNWFDNGAPATILSDSFFNSYAIKDINKYNSILIPFKPNQSIFIGAKRTSFYTRVSGNDDWQKGLYAPDYDATSTSPHNTDSSLVAYNNKNNYIVSAFQVNDNSLFVNPWSGDQPIYYQEVKMHSFSSLDWEEDVASAVASGYSFPVKLGTNKRKTNKFTRYFLGEAAPVILTGLELRSDQHKFYYPRPNKIRFKMEGGNNG